MIDALRVAAMFFWLSIAAGGGLALGVILMCRAFSWAPINIVVNNNTYEK